jgi:hypothetical protein
MLNPLTKEPFTMKALLWLAAPLAVAAGMMVHEGFGVPGSAPKAEVLGAKEVKADEPKGSFTIAGGASGLYPGGRLPLGLTVTNPQSFGIRVDTVTVKVSDPAGGGRTPKCTGAAIEIGLPGADPVPAGQPIPVSVDLGKKATASAQLEVRMIADAPDACQGASFGLTYSGTAVKS